MVRIEIDGEAFDLFPDTRITFKMRNGLITEDVIPLTYSLPFKFPMRGSKNPILLNFPENPQRKGSIQPIDVVIYLTPSKPQRAVLKINTVNQEFGEASVTVDKYLTAIADEKVRDLLKDDIGFQISPVYQKVILEMMPGSNLVNKTVSLKINESNFEQFFPSGSTTAVLFSALAVKINDADIGIVASLYSSEPGFSQLQLLNTVPGTSKLFVLDLQKYVDEWWSTSRLWAWRTHDESTWINDHTNALVSAVNSSQPNFIFPPVRNEKFSSEEKYPGWQNVYYNYNLSKKATNEGFLTPFPNIGKVVSLLMSKLGYMVTNNYLSTGDFSKLYHYSNVAADTYVRFYGATVYDDDAGHQVFSFNEDINISPSEIAFGKHLPELSLKEYLSAIKSVFNLQFIYNTVRKEVEIYPARLTALDFMSKAPDVTQYAVMPLEFTSPENEVTVIRSIGFEVDSSDELSKELEDWQKPFIINEKGNKDIVVKCSSVRDGVETIPIPTDDSQNFIGPALSIEIAGVINDSGSPAKMKIITYRGNHPSYGFALATSRNATFPSYQPTSISMEWSKTSGLYELFWKNFVTLRNDHTMMRNSMTFPAQIISKMDEIPAMFINGSLYLWKEADHQPKDSGADLSKMLWVLL